MPLPYDEFQKLVLAELDSVTRIARSLVRDQATADDLVQETFLRAIKAYQSFEPRGIGAKPWLLRILHNIHINKVTRNRAASNIEDVDVAAPEQTAPIEKIDWAQCDSQLSQAVAALPESLRSTILMWAVEELSYREISDVLGVPIGTVMSRLHRARKLLTERLEPWARREGVFRE